MAIAWKVGLPTAAGLLAAIVSFGGQAAADGLRLKDQPVAEAAPQRGVVFSGYDVVKDATYGFTGIVIALNRDISKDGWAVRAYGSRVDFEEEPGNNGHGWQGDVMFGYMFNRSIFYGGLYVGADWQNFSVDDPTSRVRGTEWGAKVSGDLTTNDEQATYFNMAGSYSTSFESYWGRVRLGANRKSYIIGAEASAFGNEDFNAQRLGAFVTFGVPIRDNRKLDITLSGGHQFVGDENGSTVGGIGGGAGTYGSLVFSTTF